LHAFPGTSFDEERTSLPVAATTFTFLLDRSPTSALPTADGITFTIQASPSGPSALGTSGSGLGYEGISNSVAIKFDLYNSSGEGTNSTGIFTGGRMYKLNAPRYDQELAWRHPCPNSERAAKHPEALVLQRQPIMDRCQR
jgi:hypothetical protein